MSSILVMKKKLYQKKKKAVVREMIFTHFKEKQEGSFNKGRSGNGDSDLLTCTFTLHLSM